MKPDKSFNLAMFQGDYPLNADIDIIKDADFADNTKGRYNYNYTYGDGNQNVFCLTGYGDLQKEA